jgi:nucleoside-diphosphate-sugar epimerase
LSSALRPHLKLEFSFENIFLPEQTKPIYSFVTQFTGGKSDCTVDCISPVETAGNKFSALLTGTLEPTNEPYAIAKIAGIKLCESYNRQYGHDYRSVMPTNLYGPNDNFHPQNSHVIPALLRRFHEAKEAQKKQVTAWGTGKPMREFLHVDDMAAACVHVMELGTETYQAHTQQNLSHINVGTGVDCTIRELTETVAKVVGFADEIISFVFQKREKNLRFFDVTYSPPIPV